MATPVHGSGMCGSQPWKELAKVVVLLQTRPGSQDDRGVGGGTVTGPRDHLLSVDQIRLV